MQSYLSHGPPEFQKAVKVMQLMAIFLAQIKEIFKI